MNRGQIARVFKEKHHDITDYMTTVAQIVFISERRALGFVQHQDGFTTFQAKKPTALKVGDLIVANWGRIGACEIDVLGTRHQVKIQYTFTTFEAALRAIAARKNRDTRRHLRLDDERV